MIIDINTELRDFTYITSVYKCIANYNLKGHQIGRKIGDMLEILTSTLTGASANYSALSNASASASRKRLQEKTTVI